MAALVDKFKGLSVGKSFDVDAVISMAKRCGWTHESTKGDDHVLIFTKSASTSQSQGIQQNLPRTQVSVWHTTCTVGTYLLHPKQGKTQVRRCAAWHGSENKIDSGTDSGTDSETDRALTSSDTFLLSACPPSSSSAARSTSPSSRRSSSTRARIQTRGTSARRTILSAVASRRGGRGVVEGGARARALVRASSLLTTSRGTTRRPCPRSGGSLTVQTKNTSLVSVSWGWMG